MRRLAPFALVLSMLGVSGSAAAAPLDLTDTTTRPVLVEFEVSSDPSDIGVLFTTPYPATYSVSGNTGTVTIDAADYEAAIASEDLDDFDLAVVSTLDAGSATDFVLDIDLTTGHATAQTASYEISITSPVPGTGTVTRTLGTQSTAGYAFHPALPGFPFFCSTTCVFVSGTPYDPITGKLNAVGEDELIAPDVDLSAFARAGDLRLSESPAPPHLPTSSLAARALLAIGIVATAWRSFPRARRRHGAC